MLPLAVYIHWPFCKFKCPYCDFNSHVRGIINHADWKRAYLEEMRFYRDKTGPRAIGSVFFGGGTPSLMEPETVAAVIDGVNDLWGLPSGVEITLEANPTSVETTKFEGFKAAGVNRVSLGVQSLRDPDLKALGRQHSAAEAIAAVHLAATLFDRYSFDLIYARPNQMLEDWRLELSEALDMAGGHLSLYQLTIEEGTAYHTLHQRGELKMPEEDLAADLYDLTEEMVSAKGFSSYEVSNYAKAGEESRHNLAYWRYQDYVGIGPGAHGRISFDGQKWATRAHKAPEIWLQRVSENRHGAHAFEKIDAPARGEEMLMMGLRLKAGVCAARFEQETGLNLKDFLAKDRLSYLSAGGMVEWKDQTLLATNAGRLKLNTLLSYLL